MLKKIYNKLTRNWHFKNPFIFFKTSKNIVLFESTSDFCDNSKALYDFLYKNGSKQLKFVWCVENPDDFKTMNLDNTKFIRFSLKGMKFREKIVYWYYSAIAKYCFYTHKPIGDKHKKHQKRVFLTHGTPIKDSRGKFWNVNFNTHIVSTSDFAADLRCKSFLGGYDKIILTGFPRNDLLFINDDKVIKKCFGINEEKIILWLPTFKHLDAVERSDYSLDTDLCILDDDNVLQFNEYLKEHNVKLIIKYHPHQNLNYVKFFNLSNVITITNSFLEENSIDLYALLGMSSALITDFSSVYLDYLLTNKPIGFEVSSLNDYKNGIGFLVDDAEEFMPGDKIKTIDDLKNFAYNVVINKDEFKLEREKKIELFHKYKDNKASERIANLFNLLKDEK